MASGFFPAVEPDAPVYSLLQEMLPAVLTETELGSDVDTRVQAELRVGIADNGDIERRRFYWSSQHPDPQSPLGFSARTLHCEGADAPRVYAFPSEPVLSWLDDADGPLRSDGRLARAEVLRYIPLRRVTFRLHDAVGLPPRVIAKVKRTGGLNRAANSFLAVQQAAGRRRPADVPRVPRLLRLDPPRHVLHLEELPGESLDVAVARMDLTEAMEQLGTLHRGLQELDVRGLPRRRVVADWLLDARHAATLIGLYVPSTARQAEEAYDLLSRTAPEDGRPLFCQGDFLPGQVLCHPSGWSVIDFDDSHYADPLSEVAAMYTALPRELSLPPDLTDRARATYLQAYERRAGEPIDPGRWHWFLMMVQLVALAKRLIKGRAAPGEATRVLEALAGPEHPGVD